MTTIDGVATRWVDVLVNHEKKRPLRTPHIFPSGDSIYSYGHHFEMARLLRDKKGSPRLFLVNGETYSNSTTRHQSAVRSAIAGTKIPKVIIPFGALSAASIDFASIQLVDDLPEGSETIKHKTLVRPEGSVWQREWRGDYVDYTPEEREVSAARETLTAQAEYDRYGKYSWADPNRALPKVTTVANLPDYYLRRWVNQVELVDVLHVKANSWATIKVTEVAEGIKEYQWETFRHWLGESVIRAKVMPTWRSGRKTPRWAYFLSGFDVQEPRPLYFLCELAKGVKPTTVAEAYLTLKPETVLLGEQMEREVRRQGDIFAVPLGLDKRAIRKAGATFVKRGNLLGTNHEATEVAFLPGGLTLARGVLYHNPRGRRPDHIRRALGKSWHVITKNTVPVTTTATRR